MTIAAVILTQNNQAVLPRLLRQLAWCDQIIVIDDQSTDNTVKLAKQFGARVFSRPLRHNFATQRNFGLRHVTTDWILFVDSDEIVTPALAEEIRRCIKSNQFAAYRLPRLDHFLGRTLYHGEAGNIHLIRLARHRAGRWHRPVHETWQVKGAIGQLKSPLYHQPHPHLASFLDKINHYTTIEARYRPLPRPTRLLFELVFLPPAKFLDNYILKLGFLDGWPGLVMAAMMSLHSLLVRLKLYEKSLAQSHRYPSAR